jgi:UDP-N-acetylmuramate dehydrogenase
MMPLPLQRDYSLQPYNTFGIDAKTQSFLPIHSVDDLLAVRNHPEIAVLPRLILGGGSNVLLTRDYPGIVLHMQNRGMAIVDEDETFTYVNAAAGESWHEFVMWTIDQGLGGLENMALIPGTVGAAPIQNIGAYGLELKDHFHQLQYLDMVTGQLHRLDKAACAFAYRDSIFKHALKSRAVIVDVTFALPKVWQANSQYGDVAAELSAVIDPQPLDVARAIMAIRSRKLPNPAVIGNAGSFFKNPIISAEQFSALQHTFPNLVSYPQADGRYKLAAGWLIDQCGWRGRTLGAAGVYDKQALVLVNLGQATGHDIVQLSDAIRADVHQRFHVWLEPEPVFI